MPQMPGEAEENEDTTQDDGNEETEDESTEDAGDDDSETDDSDEGTSDDQEDESQDKGEGKKNVFNPNELPEELKPIWKRMQAHLTRKHQVYSAGIKKAGMWDKLIQLPEFRKWYNDYTGGGSSAQGESDDQGGEGAQDSVTAQRLEALEKSHFHVLAEREFSDFAKARPDWKVYQHEIFELMEEDPQLTYEKAYRIAAFDGSEEKGTKKGIQKLSSKKRANLGKPTGGGGLPRPDTAPKTIREAAEMAERQLGMRK